MPQPETESINLRKKYDIEMKRDLSRAVVRIREKQQVLSGAGLEQSEGWVCGSFHRQRGGST